MRPIVRWLRSLFVHRRVEQDMHDEMREHLERATERFMARGLSADEARRAALREFGNVHYLQEEARDARGGRWVGALTPDARLALRMLVKNPLLSVVGGLGMAVAIAITTGVSTLMTFYYSDPPVEDGDRVVSVEYVDGPDFRSAPFDYLLWKDELESIRDLAAYRRTTRELESPVTGFGPIEVAEMTASGFRVARVPPLLGRPLLDSDEVEGAPPVIVLGHREWQQRFGGDPAVIGSDVRLDGTAHTIVGVMPEGFRLPVNDGAWTALSFGFVDASPASRTNVDVFGRLAPGQRRDAAAAEVETIADRMVADYPQFYGRPRALVAPYMRQVMGLESLPAWQMWLVQLFAVLVLTAVAVNVGVLFYARTALRRHEIVVRTALGASRARIVTQLFLEALALSAAAAAAGLLFARVGFRQLTLVEDFADDLPAWFGGLPPETIAYAAVLAVLAALVVGVLPALQATGRHLESTLREMGGGTALRMGRTWTVLICVQVAVAVGVLPAVVGIAWNYTLPPTPTFPASEILSFRLRPPPPPADPAAAAQPGSDGAYGSLQAELLSRVDAMPGVSGVTFASRAPGVMPGVRIEVENPTGVSELTSRSYRVDAGYFGVMGVSLLAGRTFNRDDAVRGAGVAMVSRAFVDEYLAGGATLGRRFREWSPAASDEVDRGPWVEVVGVIEDMLRPSRGRPARPAAYYPVTLGTESLALAARTKGTDALTIAPRVREIAEETAPDLDVRVAPLDAVYAWDANELRLLLLLVALATLSVLLLSAAGISAMMSFAVTQRQREVGIRTALGATQRQVIASIFSRATRQLGTGLLIGTAGAALLDRLTGGDMLGGSAGPLLGLVATIILASGLLATLGPARRALRIEPMHALREE